MLIPNPSPLSDADGLCRLGVAELTALYRKSELSPVEVVLKTLDRAETINGRYNAFTYIDHEGAIEQARAAEQRWRAGAPLSPIDGIPTTLKDIVWVKGWVVSSGSLAMQPQPQREDAPAVQRLRHAGAVFLGLTTTPEIGWKAVTDSPLSGVTRNPWMPSATSGGSSGGAAVAAATGAGVLHLGTDGGGSVRIPASFTGTVGFKPTFARVPSYPASAFGTLAHIGPMARAAEDAEAMLAVMAGKDVRDWTQCRGEHASSERKAIALAGARVGYWSQPATGEVDPEVAQIVEKAVCRIASAGARVEPMQLPGIDLLDVFHHHWFCGAAARVDSIPEVDRGRLDPGLREIARLGRQMSTGLVSAQMRRAEFGSAMDRLLDDFDVLVSPATAVAAFEAGHEVPPGGGLSRWTEWAGFSFPINLSQQPACVIPCGVTADGRPVGIQLVGARGGDYRLLSLTREVEHLLGSP
ncbi:amidase (plasmid) [Variovorax sp. V59]|uniref:amidase n=1 Tax=unclassified Variovorax TaxID=663243 RepID=UPI0034E8D52C